MPQKPRAFALRLLGMLFAVLIIFAVFAPTTATAATRTYTDCERCRDNGGWIIISVSCQYPSSGGWGDAVCKEIDVLMGGTESFDSTLQCMYLCVGPGCDTYGGGGSPGGGSDGSSCASGGYCPPSCFSCGGNYY